MPSTLTPIVEYTTPITIPSDGDAGVVASVNLAFQAIANRVEYIKPGYKLVSEVWRYIDDTSDANGSNGTTSSTSYVDLTGWVPGNPALALVSGDIVEVEANMQVSWSGAGNAGGFVKIVAFDGSLNNDVHGGKYYQSNNDSSIARTVTLAGWYTAATSVTHTFKVRAKCLSGSDTFAWTGHAAFRVRIWRAT